MNVSLTPELEEYVAAKVKSGLYNSASEVVREGLRLVHEQEQIRELKLDNLRKEIQKGIDSLERGEGIACHSVEEVARDIKARGRQRRQEGQEKAEAVSCSA